VEKSLHERARRLGLKLRIGTSLFSTHGRVESLELELFYFIFAIALNAPGDRSIRVGLWGSSLTQ
jgi:hypothetical protein